MVKKLTISLLISVLFAGYAVFDLNRDIKTWEPYVQMGESIDDLEYAFKTSNYSELYKGVVANNALGIESKYDNFAYFHEHLVKAVQKLIMGQDFEKDKELTMKYYSLIEEDQKYQADLLFEIYGIEN